MSTDNELSTTITGFPSADLLTELLDFDGGSIAQPSVGPMPRGR